MLHPLQAALSLQRLPSSRLLPVKAEKESTGPLGLEWNHKEKQDVKAAAYGAENDAHPSVLARR